MSDLLKNIKITTLEALRELNMSNNKIAEVKQGKLIKMWGLEVLNLASNNFESLNSISGISDLKNLRNINLLSNPIFVMKQKEEKERIKTAIIEYWPSLKILNWEELVQSPQLNIQTEGIFILIKICIAKQEPNKTSTPIAQPEPKIEINVKEKQKKQSESVISIIEEEWNGEIQRLKDSGLYLTNYKRVPKFILDTKDPNFDVKKANTYCVESGHAEIESNKILLIFGNALEVLHREEFHDSVEEIYIGSFEKNLKII